MADLRYSRDHEWVRIEADLAVIGISAYAQAQLGDVVFVELPAHGKTVTKGEEAAVVESVKAASEVFTPVTGEVVAVNDPLAEDPGLVNRAPTSEGWFLKIRMADPREVEGLMDEAAYRAYVAAL